MGACDETRPYRLGVGIVLVNRMGQVFAGQRIDSDQPAWQMPQGGIEEGEDPRTAAFRDSAPPISCVTPRPAGHRSTIPPFRR